MAVSARFVGGGCRKLLQVDSHAYRPSSVRLIDVPPLSLDSASNVSHSGAMA